MRMSDEAWADVLNVNLTGAFFMARAVPRPMLRTRGGRIINISSVSRQMGDAGQANYSASKAGLIGLTKALVREVASHGITVNAVAPGFVVAPADAGAPDGHLLVLPA
jgi:3-oxoacyl-[acyl-carrier protein] reductase